MMIHAPVMFLISRRVEQVHIAIVVNPLHFFFSELKTMSCVTAFCMLSTESESSLSSIFYFEKFFEALVCFPFRISSIQKPEVHRVLKK